MYYREYPGREIIEDDETEEPCNEGKVAVNRLPGRLADVVLPIGEGAHCAHGRFKGYQTHGNEVTDAEGWLPDPRPLEKRSSRNGDLASHGKENVKEMKADNQISEDGKIRIQLTLSSTSSSTRQ